MNDKNNILIFSIGLSLILGTAPVSQAKIEATDRGKQFARIEQPVSLKILVTLGGLGLIGAELWWFLRYPSRS